MVLRNTVIAVATVVGSALLASPLAAASHDHKHGGDKGHKAMSMKSVEVTMHKVSAKGVGDAVGTVTLVDGPCGLVVVPDLKGVPTGAHATHVHAKPDCGPATKDGKTIVAGAAGGHYDPKGAGQYLGPYLDGALGDLPNLFAEADGSVTIPVVAPRLKLADVRGRALMMHAGPDHYRAVAMDHKVGKASHSHGHSHAGAGPRILCGVIP